MLKLGKGGGYGTLIVIMMFLLSMGLIFGCDQMGKIFDSGGVSAEKGLDILVKAEAFYPKVQLAVTEYNAAHPGEIPPADWEKIKAANTAFITAYVTSKKAIQDIIILKKGEKVTLPDIGGELVIFAGKYMEFKQAIEKLTGGKVTVAFPDEKTLPAGTTEEMIKKITPVTATPKVSAPATTAPS